VVKEDSELEEEEEEEEEGVTEEELGEAEEAM
jgi:hypothetical protein